MNRNFYPYYIAPAYHKSPKIFKDYTFVYPEFTLEEPILSKVEPEGEGWLLMTVLCIILIVLGTIEMDSGGVILLTPGFYGSLISYWLFKRGKRKQLENEKKAIEKYNYLVKAYNIKFKQYKNEEQELQQIKILFNCATNEDRIKAIKYLMNNNDVHILAKGYHKNTLKGLSERDFFKHLVLEFGNHISSGNCVKEHYGREFYPDFIYSNESRGLFIDIEIDEPYSYKEREPIHYIGANAERDNFFEGIFWGVIRFSENQILSYPRECVFFIKDYINSIIENVDVLDWPLNYEERWTLEEAKSLIDQDFRSASALNKNQILERRIMPKNERHIGFSEESAIIDYAIHYHSLGLNLTCIHKTENKYNEIVKDKLKHPCHRYKFLGREYRQLMEEMLSYPWLSAVGVGTVTGFDDLVVLDIDESNSIELVNLVLKFLELPSNYEWITKSGSGNGYHIYIRTSRPKSLSRIYVVSTYKPNLQFKDDYAKLEVLWNTHIVMPPSLHKSGGKYSFLGGVPYIRVTSVEIDKVLTCLGIIADLSSVKHGTEYKEEVE